MYKMHFKFIFIVKEIDSRPLVPNMCVIRTRKMCEPRVF